MRTFDQNEMADFIAIQRLQASYADIVTRREWSELEQIFLPDATVTIDMLEGYSLRSAHSRRHRGVHRHQHRTV